MSLLSVITTSSAAFIAILGTFVVFRLQWLRKEIDDYRGRIIDILHPGPYVENVLTDQYTQEFETLKKLPEKYRGKDKEELYDKKDKQFASDLKEIINSDEKIKELPLIIRDFVGPHKHATLGGSCKLFNSRYSQKRKVLLFTRLSGAFLLISFFVSAAEGADLKLSTILKFVDGDFWFLIFLIGVALIFGFLYRFLKEDY